MTHLAAPASPLDAGIRPLDRISASDGLRFREPLLKASSGLRQKASPAQSRVVAYRGSDALAPGRRRQEGRARARPRLRRGRLRRRCRALRRDRRRVGHGQPVRRHRARLAPASKGRPGGVSGAAGPRHPHPHPDAHGSRLAPRSSVGPRQRGRRLPDQALRVRRAPGPDSRAPAAFGADAATGAQGRRPDPRSGHASRDPRRRRDQPDAEGVRDPRDPDAARGPGGVADTDRRVGLARRPRGPHEPRRRAREPPAQEDRRGGGPQLIHTVRSRGFRLGGAEE